MAAGWAAGLLLKPQKKLPGPPGRRDRPVALVPAGGASLHRTNSDKTPRPSAAAPIWLAGEVVFDSGVGHSWPGLDWPTDVAQIPCRCAALTPLQPNCSGGKRGPELPSLPSMALSAVPVHPARGI